MIKTIDDLRKSLPEENEEIDPLLMSNLAILGLAISGDVKITGFDNGKLMSENTEQGKRRHMNYILSQIQKK